MQWLPPPAGVPSCCWHYDTTATCLLVSLDRLPQLSPCQDFPQECADRLRFAPGSVSKVNSKRGVMTSYSPNFPFSMAKHAGKYSTRSAGQQMIHKPCLKICCCLVLPRSHRKLTPTACSFGAGFCRSLPDCFASKPWEVITFSRCMTPIDVACAAIQRAAPRDLSRTCRICTWEIRR